jgi:hypothetical protein
MTGTKTILGFIAGASIGAIAAILFSPDKGSDTRRKIIDKSSDLGNSLKDCLVDFIKGERKVKASTNGEPYSSSEMNLNTMGWYPRNGLIPVFNHVLLPHATAHGYFIFITGRFFYICITKGNGVFLLNRPGCYGLMAPTNSIIGYPWPGKLFVGW